MSFRRNWFTYLSLYLYLTAGVLILIFGVTQFKEGKEYPLLSQVLLILGMFAVFAIIHMLLYLLTRPGMVMAGEYIKRKCPWIEWLFVLLILAGGIVLRIQYINTYSVNMESDYKFYYDVAKMIMNHTLLTQANNEYICLFPNTFGYSYVLSWVMRIFGTAPIVCLYFNVVISALTSVFCYRIGKNLTGSIGGIAAFLISWFWPSQIIFSNINGSEATFTCILFGAVLLTVYVMKEYGDRTTGTVTPVFLHFLLGILLSAASAIRPMSIIYFIALVLCLLTVNKKLVYKNINELPLGKIFVSKGWLRAIVVIAGYLICTQVINGGISNAIQKDAAGSGAMGYSLMVGVNIASDGGYSEDLMNILNNSYEETGSATEAHKICLGIARQSVLSNPLGTLELFAKKFFLIWSNDDYATTTSIVTMNNQNILTPARENFMYGIVTWNNAYYLFVVFLSLLGVVYLFRQDNNGLILPVFFVGASILHILVEMQNRYHYYLLGNFALLAAVGIGFLFQEYLQRTKVKIPELEYSFDAIPVAAALESAEEVEENRKEDVMKENTYPEAPAVPMLSHIDVLKAIEEGHIIITATEAYRNINKSDSLEEKTNENEQPEKEDKIPLTPVKTEAEQFQPDRIEQRKPDKSEQREPDKINKRVTALYPVNKRRKKLKKKTTLSAMVKRRITYNKKGHNSKKMLPVRTMLRGTEVKKRHKKQHKKQ
ncbi:MAG: hypothetical protein WCD89_01035 [Anaerocolumna sp.]